MHFNDDHDNELQIGVCAAHFDVISGALINEGNLHVNERAYRDLRYFSQGFRL